MVALRLCELRRIALEVRFPDDKEGCAGAHGRFTTSTNPRRISICPTELVTVYEHELAHAWERANLTDAQRQTFMEMRGYDVWNDKSVPWRERGMEGAAVIIQQGVNGLPLPPALSDEAMSRLAAFQLLTGFPDPRLVGRAHNLDHHREDRVSGRSSPPRGDNS